MGWPPLPRLNNVKKNCTFLTGWLPLLWSIITKHLFCLFIRLKSNYCLFLYWQSLCHRSCWILFKLDFSNSLHAFLLVVKWICQNGSVYFAGLLHGFVKIDVWISLSCAWICQSCYMDFSKLLNGLSKLMYEFF